MDEPKLESSKAVSDFDPSGAEPPPLPMAVANSPKTPPVVAASPAPKAMAKTPPSGPPTAKARLKTTLEMVAGHWCVPSVGVDISPPEFYDLVTKAVMERKIPGVEFSRVYWKEEAFIGAKREYLRVQRGRIVYDICAAPQGAGSFFSSWLCIVPFLLSATHLLGIFVAIVFIFWLIPVSLVYAISLFLTGGLWWMYCRVATTTSFGSDFLLGLTGVGPLLKFFAELKPTYYQIDAALIFQSAVQESVLGVIDKLCERQNVRTLTELERKPTMREFMKK